MKHPILGTAFATAVATAVSAAALPALAQPTSAQPASPASPQPLDVARRADGATLVPDRFLRRWDPVTVFFSSDQGPAQGGPEDSP